LSTGTATRHWGARQAERRREIDQPREHALSGEIDDARVRRGANVGANRLDEPIANHHRAALDDAARDRLDARVGQCPGPVLRCTKTGEDETDDRELS
jgi:hypothetical protein